tara:strand:- start:10576 stop:11874 length:1299 start_codon:yes stop_codon:yes gene_type:complete
MKRIALFVAALVMSNIAQAVNVEKLNLNVTDRALFVQQEQIPTVKVLLSFKAGTIFEDEYAHGTANLLANLITAGTEDKTAKQIQEELEKLASDIYIYSSRDELKVEVTSLAENIEPTLVILQDVLTKATFPEKEVNILKSSVAQAIKQQKENPNVLAVSKARKEFYGEDNIKAYVSNLGTLKSINTISRNDVKDYYEEYITKENVSISVVASLPKEQMETLLDTYLSAMHTGARKQLVAPIPVGQTNRALIHKELPQTTVMLYTAGIGRTDANYYPSVIFNYILGGGGFSSRLMEEIREKRGLTYGVRSGFEYDLPYQGIFTISLQTSNVNKYKTESLIRKELGKIINKGVTEKEMNDAKDFLVGSFPVRLRTSDKLLGYLNVMQKFNLDLNYLNEWEDKVAAVTLDEVNDFAKEIIKNEVDLSRVYVGGM